MFAPAPGGYEWVELKNDGAAPANPFGYRITDEDGNEYRLPGALPDVPPGAFVVVLFDGLGAAGNDLDFADNVATLHTGSGVVDVFEDDTDQVALYNTRRLVYLPLVLSGSTGAAQAVAWNLSSSVPAAAIAASDIVSFVAWGADPGTDAANAVAAGIWPAGTYRGLGTGLGEVFGSAVPNDSIGLVPGGQGYSVDDWTYYEASRATKGTENPLPVASWHYPVAGATLDSVTFALSWNPLETATGYRFQMDNDADFSSPAVDLVLLRASYLPDGPVAAGVYYWRVKGIFAAGESDWSAGLEVRSMDLPYTSFNGVLDVLPTTLGVPWQLQHKDTKMVCLDGDPETGAGAWDSPHVSTGVHGAYYCVQASVAMLAS